jgi:hypothetical protein
MGHSDSRKLGEGWEGGGVAGENDGEVTSLAGKWK